MIYLGIDVAKAKLDCSLLLDTASNLRKTTSVPNTKLGVATLLDWVASHGSQAADLHVVMEATGAYHQQAALTLFDAGVRVSIVNPAQARDFARGLAVRTKTDGVDSFVLARFGALLKPKAWQPPALEVRELQALLTRRDALAHDLRRERNRQEKTLLSDISTLVRQSLISVIGCLEEQLKLIEKAITAHVADHAALKRDMDLLTSIPAIGPRTGVNLLALMHTIRFNTAEQMAAYLGVVPIERQSGSSIAGQPRMSKAGPSNVRGVLYMAAVVGISRNPHIKALYERLLARGKAKMSALGAAMRKLIHLCFGVVKSGQPYRADHHAIC